MIAKVCFYLSTFVVFVFYCCFDTSMILKNKYSLISFIIGVSMILFMSFLWIYNKYEHKANILAFDVAGYYSYLPAIFIYKDIKQLEWRDDIRSKYNTAGINEVAFTHESGNKVMKYSSGMAISYLPGFLAAHAFTLSAGYEPDGFSQSYSYGLIIIGLIYAMIGMWFLRKILLVYFTDIETSVALLITVIGTNYFLYAATDMAMSHVYLFMLYTLLIWHTIQWYDRRTYARSAIIGLLIGLITITRPTEILVTLLPLFWGVYSVASFKERLALFRALWRYYTLPMITGAIVISIQLFYWYYTSGDIVVYSYGDEGFNWDGRYLFRSFFSYRKGWLLYTPVMIFAIIGLYYLCKDHATSKIAKPIIAFLIINTYIIFSWHAWEYGGGFGQRALISSYVLYAFGLAALVRHLLNRKWWLRLLVGSGVLFCIWLNLFQTYQVHICNRFETMIMNKAYYWKIFGEAEILPEWQIRLDSDEFYDDEIRDSLIVMSNDFEDEIYSDQRSYAGSRSFYFKKGKEMLAVIDKSKVEDLDWIRLQSMISGECIEWAWWDMIQLIIEVKHQGKQVKYQIARPNRIVNNATWKQIELDLKLPNKEYDTIECYLVNTEANCGIYFDDLRLISFKD